MIARPRHYCFAQVSKINCMKKRYSWVIGFLIVCTGAFAQHPANAQTQSQTQPQKAGGQNDSTAQQSAADIPGAKKAAADANADRSNPKDSASSETASNAPAVSETTTSASGSPAVLSGNNGRDRDGTNSVQRASMNMAGSPTTNLNLNGHQTTDVSSEARDRQALERGKQASEENASAQNGESASKKQSGEVNQKSRRENNDASDQNLSAKDKKNDSGDKGSKRKKSKNDKRKG